MSADTSMWFVTKVDADEANCCIEHEHWDVWYWHAEVETIRNEPGIFDGKLKMSEANVMCILGEEADVRRLVDLRNASLRATKDKAA